MVPLIGSGVVSKVLVPLGDGTLVPTHVLASRCLDKWTLIDGILTNYKRGGEPIVMS